MECFLCIHCHFYQPPRENPWLEAVESQDSAHPYHDWNERIAAECYLPNGASRILDGNGQIAKIVNNYARISFNFGPTLLSWMEQRLPQAYEQILRADHESRRRFCGHGSALAQAYNHLILPLANTRDKNTQIIWGIKDFQQRFHRDPEGMWLPETAVDVETLELLSTNGIKFTILAPHQAARMRASSQARWIDLDGKGIDSRKAYVCHLPSGRTIGIFFYDGANSRAVAFDKLLSDGQNFARRLVSRFDPEGPSHQLIHIATDGETYGHHHAHGDMALAYALDYIEQHKLARLTNYGEYFSQHPPECQVEILERSSWSCAHGIGRWNEDCGCNAGANGEWNQKWRRPLREALDWLRDDLADLYEEQAGEFLLDPWAARDEYVHLVINRSPSTADSFFAKHAVRELSHSEKTRVLRLLELQRHLMLMYTSCGWFFDEPTGPETVQVLQYAGRAVQLSEQLFGGHREEQLLTRLEKVRSNIAEFGNGRAIYERFVWPAMLDMIGVAAHYAISALFDGYHSRNSLYCYTVDLHESRMFENGRAKLAFGRATLTASVTRVQFDFSFAALHFGDQNLYAGICPGTDHTEFASAVEEAHRTFEKQELAESRRILERYFRGATYSLKSLFHDERQRIIGEIVNSTLSDIDAMHSQVYEEHASLISFLSEVRLPMPAKLRASAEFAIGHAIEQWLSGERVVFHEIRMLLATAHKLGVNLENTSLRSTLGGRLGDALNRWAQRPFDLKLLKELDGLVSLAKDPPFRVDLWKAQTLYYELLTAVSAKESAALSGPWVALFCELGKQLEIAVPQSLQGRHTTDKTTAHATALPVFLSTSSSQDAGPFE